MTQVFDDFPCELGESPLWHPKRDELIWLDMFGKKLKTKSKTWQFDEYVSACGWIDRDHILVASETALFSFNLETDARQDIVALEADIPTNRSNDGRADPWGGFWIGTMSKTNADGEGAFYRYYRGELRQILSGITITNSLCFDPAKQFAYFTDTTTQCIERLPLDPETGWPVGGREVFIDMRADDLNPDGSVFDRQGRLWNAQWGASRLACYDDGVLVDSITFPTTQITCPAFGGADYNTLFATSAAVDVQEAEAGKTFSVQTSFGGVPEPRVIL